MRAVRRYGFMGLLVYGVIGLWGCATVMEKAKGIAGVSTKVLEDTRKDAISQTFNYDYDTCYNKTKEILAHIGAYIYARNTKKQMVAIYISEEDTTPVGLFFKRIDAHKTQIEVSSASTYAKEFIAAKLFSLLEKPFNLEKKGEPDAREGIQDK